MYALANDENGLPVDVPVGAFGWLVRKHSGGKGRPAAVYDHEGRPMVVALDSTAADLASMGVAAGSYRLDAVDERRRQMGVVAYTEIKGKAEDDEEAPADAAVMALARAVEAMQRVQAERERVQAQMFMRLIDRLAPVPMPSGDDLKGALGQMVEVQKTLKRLAPAESAQRNALPESEGEEVWWNSPVIAGTLQALVQQGGPLVTKWLWSKMGLTADEMAGLSAPPAAQAQEPVQLPAAVDGTPKEIADDEKTVPTTVPVVAASSERQRRFDDVMKELTAAEQQKVLEALNTLPAAVIVTAEEKLMSLPAKEAAAFLRKVMAEPGVPIAIAATRGEKGAQGE